MLPRALLEIGASVTKIIAVAQQYALPLVLGIVVALFAANFDAKRYDRWAGSWHPPPTAHWGYGTDDGPRFWASLAREGWLLPPVGAVAKGGEWDVCHFGKEQSPINIPWRASGLDRAQTNSTHHRLLHRLVRPSDDTTFAVQQAHGAPVFMCGDGLGDCGTLVLDSVTYNLAQFHFHTPSENTVDGAQAPMTVHMVHCTGGCALGVDSFAVVTLLFEGGEPEASSTPKTKIIDALWPHLDDRGTMGDGSGGARVERRPVNAIGVRVPAPGWFGEAMPDPDAGVSAVGAPTDPLSLAGLFSESSGYVTWKGSLTTPPCTEGLTWLLQAEPVQIHQSQIDAFWKHIGWFKQSPLGNARPAQPLYEREVTFFVDDDATGASATSVGAQTVEPEPSATVPNPCGLKRPGGVPPHGCGHHHDRPSIFGLRIGPAGRPFGKHLFTLNFLVNDILMVFFFGLAAKEIAEALQPGGSLYPPTRKIVNPLLSTAGGVLGPIVAYYALLAIFDGAGWLDSEYAFADYAAGWGVPTATDISLAWVTACAVFGTGHPAINFLLLLAVVDDGIGLIIIAIAYPNPNAAPQREKLVLILVAMAVAYCLRRVRCAAWQPYVFIAGPIAWCGLYWSALHPALALVFVVPFMPLQLTTDRLKSLREFISDDSASAAADRAYQRAIEESGLPTSDSHAAHHAHSGFSPLHKFEEDTKAFVDFVVMFAFGAVNAGVQVDQVGPLTWVVALALIGGKTLGVAGMSLLASEALGFERPVGMERHDTVVVGLISGVGLTVALFVSGQAFMNEPVLQGQAKMGALFSVSASALALLVAPARRRRSATLAARRAAVEVAPSLSVGVLSRVTLAASRAKECAVDDETLEDVIVDDMQRQLRLIHKLEDAMHQDSGISRAEAEDLMRSARSSSAGGWSRRSLRSVSSPAKRASPAPDVAGAGAGLGMPQLTPISVVLEHRGNEIELPLLSHADDAAANEEMKMESDPSVGHHATGPVVIAARPDGLERASRDRVGARARDSTDSIVSEALGSTDLFPGTKEDGVPADPAEALVVNPPFSLGSA